MYKRLAVTIGLLPILLIGCTHGGPQQTIQFDTYQISIDEAFREVSTGLVENKQILNKLLKSYKKDEERTFATNLIITRSDLPPGLDFEQFWTANSSKIRAFLVGYKGGNKELRSFTCNGSSINGIYVTFKVENTFLGDGGPYHFAQYQFVHNNKGYIISYATAEPAEQNNLKNIIATLSC